MTLHSQSPPEACKDRITTKTQTAGGMKTSLPEVRARYTPPTCIYWKSDRALQRNEKKTVRKTSWRNRLGKKTWYIIREEICHKHIPPPRLISSYFNTGEGCMCLRCCDAAPKHHTKTEFRRHSVTGVVNTTNLPAKAACV